MTFRDKIDYHDGSHMEPYAPWWSAAFNQSDGQTSLEQNISLDFELYRYSQLVLHGHVFKQAMFSKYFSQNKPCFDHLVELMSY